LLCLLPAAALAFAGDGIPPRGSAEDYPAHQTSGKVAIGAALVPSAQVKKIFGEDLAKHGYLVCEVGVFPIDGTSPDVASGGFELALGKDTGIVRAATPHAVAAAVRAGPDPWEEWSPGGVAPPGSRIFLDQQLQGKSLPEGKTWQISGRIYFIPQTLPQSVEG
jgi:hypothetical protein